MAFKDSKPLIDIVYGRLRDLILSNELHAGQKLVDRDLAEQLNVSRTPIREALGRLTMMGLVENRSQRGYYVRQYTSAEMADLYEFRKILEVNAATLAAENATSEHLRKFGDILIQLEEQAASTPNPAKVVELDLEIHDLIARASGNESLHQASQNMMDRVMCTIWVNWVETAGSGMGGIVSNLEHQGIIEKILERDVEGVAELVGAHIDNARDALTETLNARDEIRRFVLQKAAS